MADGPVRSTQGMLQYNFKTKARAVSGGLGGKLKCSTSLQKKGYLSSPLGSSHPSEKATLLPGFYETPAHQSSNCSQRVLRFSVSNEEQLHLRKTCFFPTRLSPKGWSGVGGTPSLPAAPFWGSPLPRDTGMSRNGLCPTVVPPAPARMTPPQVRRSLLGHGRGIPPVIQPKSFTFISDPHSNRPFGSAEVFPRAPAEKQKLLDLSAPCSISRPRMAASKRNRGRVPAGRRRPGRVLAEQRSEDRPWLEREDAGSPRWAPSGRD